MGLFGLSNKAVSFLGGVASGVEEVIDKDEAYTNELVKDSASMIIKARLDSKERRRQRVSEYSKEMSQLVAVGYGKQESEAYVYPASIQRVILSAPTWNVRLPSLSCKNFRTISDESGT